MVGNMGKVAAADLDMQEVLVPQHFLHQWMADVLACARVLRLMAEACAGWHVHGTDC